MDVGNTNTVLGVYHGDTLELQLANPDRTELHGG